MTKRRLIVGVVGALLVAAGASGWYYVRRPPARAGDYEPVATTNARALHAAFLADEAAANARYVGRHRQAIRVDGVIGSIRVGPTAATMVTLETDHEEGRVLCEFLPEDAPVGWQVGMAVQVQCICVGLTELIPDVILMRCVVP